MLKNAWQNFCCEVLSTHSPSSKEQLPPSASSPLTVFCINPFLSKRLKKNMLNGKICGNTVFLSSKESRHLWISNSSFPFPKKGLLPWFQKILLISVRRTYRGCIWTSAMTAWTSPASPGHPLNLSPWTNPWNKDGTNGCRIFLRRKELIGI